MQAQVPIHISNNQSDNKVRELELKVELLETALQEAAASAEIGISQALAQGAHRCHAADTLNDLEATQRVCF
jgi:hypothetical protein